MLKKAQQILNKKNGIKSQQSKNLKRLFASKANSPGKSLKLQLNMQKTIADDLFDKLANLS